MDFYKLDKLLYFYFISQFVSAAFTFENFKENEILFRQKFFNSLLNQSGLNRIFLRNNFFIHSNLILNLNEIFDQFLLVLIEFSIPT